MGFILILAFCLGALAILVRAHPRAQHPEEVLLVCDSLLNVTLSSPTFLETLKTTESAGNKALRKQVSGVEREIGAEITGFFDGPTATVFGLTDRVDGPVVLRQLLGTLKDHVPKLPAAATDDGRYLCLGCSKKPLLGKDPGVLRRADDTGLLYHRVLYGD